jgi:UDP-4-amino-4,6-dideoxy-N-acetyl-beta-L-altrosamine transaminase
MIPYGRQEITEADVEAVVAALRSDFLTQGPAIGRFEEATTRRFGAAHARAANSATSALHMACLALGVGPGDLLWTVPNTFVASANCARYCGADVDFVDIDHDTWNLSVPKLEEKLIAAKASGRLPKVVVPVHFAGQPTEQEAIWAFAKKYGFRVIEDASHAVGASFNGEPVGSCRWSDITIFSFHPVKIITTGEGGMALTKDAELAERLGLFRSHGITRDPKRFQCQGHTGDAWYHEQQMLGYNYRITDIQAVLGMSQLERLDEYVDRRNEMAQRYDEALSDLPLQLPMVLKGNRSAFHLYVVRLAPGSVDSHRRVFAELRARGVGVNVHYMPVHLQPYYRALGFHEGQFPEAEAHGATAITLPLFPALTTKDQESVVTALRAVL